MASSFFFEASVSFLLGIFFASLAPVPFLRPLVFFSFAGSCLFGFFWFKSKPAKMFFLAIAFFCLAIWRYSLSLPVFLPNSVEHWHGYKAIGQGLVVKEPDWRPGRQNLFVRVNYLRLNQPAAKQDNLGVLRQKFFKTNGLILITSRQYPKYHYGDVIEFSGYLQPPQPFADFAYDRYLARFGIYTVCFYPQIKLISKNNLLGAKFFVFKQKWRQIIQRGLPAPEAEFAQAILIGDKHALSKYWRQVFSGVGLSHIMAISGMHISILAAIIINFLVWAGLQKKYAFWLTAGIIGLYIILIGAPASALRAGIVGFLVLFGLAFGRLAGNLNLLALAAVSLLLINPRLLRDDIGFQLSFLAVLGIILFYNFFNEQLKQFRLTKFLPAVVRSVLAITVSAQLMTWPIVVYNFKIFSLVSILANVLVVWALPLILVSLLLASLAALFWPPTLVLFFAPAYLLLFYLKTVALALFHLKFSFLPIAQIHYLWLVFWYGLLAGWYYSIIRPGLKI